MSRRAGGVATPGRSRAALLLAGPLALRGSFSALLDVASYALLVARTVPGTARSARAERESARDRWSAALARLRQLATGSRRVGQLGARVFRHYARSCALARERCGNLAAQGVREVAVLGGGFAAQWVRAIAPAHGLRVHCWGEDSRELIARAGTRPLLVADRDVPELHTRALAGVSPARVYWLEPPPPSDTSPPETGSPKADPDLDLSIVLPSRGRPQIAAALLEQIHRSASSPERIEVLLLLDDDDPQSHDVDHPRLRVRRLIAPRRRMSELTNAGARAARAEALLLFNDDVRIGTPGWDRALLGALARFSDGIACVYTNDRHQRRRSATFPLISRSVVRELGYAAPRALRHYHIESHLMAIFRRLRRMGLDRLVYLESVTLEHRDLPRSAPIPQWGHSWDDGATYAALRSERGRAARALRAAIERAAGQVRVTPPARAPWVRPSAAASRRLDAPSIDSPSV